MRLAACSLYFIAALAHGQDTDSCRRELQEHFDTLKQHAARLSLPAGRAYIESATVYFGHIDTMHHAGSSAHARNDGRANLIYAEVKLDPELLCASAPATRELVVAHELGHLLSYVMRPDIKQNSRYATPWQIEAWGNEYGAQILRDAGRSHIPALKIADEFCARGDQYQCDRAMAWRSGLLY